MNDLSETEQQITGVRRTAVQALVVYLVVQITPLLEALGVDSAEVEALVYSIVIGAYWLFMTWLQNLEPVQRSFVMSKLVAILMGGGKPPTYIDVEVVDA